MHPVNKCRDHNVYSTAQPIVAFHAKFKAECTREVSIMFYLNN